MTVAGGKHGESKIKHFQKCIVIINIHYLYSGKISGSFMKKIQANGQSQGMRAL